MIVMLDDIGKAFYTRLKKESDSLLKTRNEIKYKRKLVLSLSEAWLEAESLELDEEADRMYNQKHQAELELQDLERAERETLERIKFYVNSKARSA